MAGNPRLDPRCLCGCDGPVCEAKFGTREFRVICLACPLLIEGHVDGWPFSFRARHDRWRLEVPGGGLSRQLAPDEVIASGDTDDFTVGQAADLITDRMNRWIWPGETR